MSCIFLTTSSLSQVSGARMVLPDGRGRGSTSVGPKWTDLKPGLSPWILQVVEGMGFERTTPVQYSTIPRAMGNQDCVVEAVTGSGKTLAFVIPVLERITRRLEPYKKGEVASIIIAPTRELAQQIHEVFQTFIKALHDLRESSTASSSSSPPPLSHDAPNIPLPLLVTSGNKVAETFDDFISLSSSILVGTPGRLASFLLSPRGESLIRVSDLDVLVLDEADRLLSSPDHRKDVERIMRYLPKQRRTHLFSATMTDAVEELVGVGLRNPVKIVVNLKDKRIGEEPKERRLPTSLENTFITCRHAEKTVQLLRILQNESLNNEAAKFIVYFATGAEVDYFYRVLSRLPRLHGFTLVSLHGDLPARVRDAALNKFTTHPSTHLAPAVLLCTDLASRGVDFENVDVVIQYDSPTDPKTFSHRVGRTARAGRKGKGILLLGKGSEEAYVDFLRARKIPLAVANMLDSDVSAAGPSTGIDQDALALRDEIRSLILTDRELADKGAKAFVSFLKAYTKHEASFIFRLEDLDLGGLATAYGLLRLPAMPEVRSWRDRVAKLRKVEGTDGVAPEMALTSWNDAEVDWNSFAYASKTREEARLAALKTKEDRPKESDKKRRAREEMREAWSEQKDKKVRKEERRSQKDKRKEAEWERKVASGETEDVGMVESFRRQREAGQDEEDAGRVDLEYKAMKKEVKEEKMIRKAQKGGQGGLKRLGMFDDLD